MTHKTTISFVRLCGPSALPNASGEPSSMPAFYVEGEYNGSPFAISVCFELDGRDCEWTHIDGEPLPGHFPHQPISDIADYILIEIWNHSECWRAQKLLEQYHEARRAS